MSYDLLIALDHTFLWFVAWTFATVILLFLIMFTLLLIGTKIEAKEAVTRLFEACKQPMKFH